MNIEERFWSQVNKTDTCWLWTGYINPGGYGIAKSMGRRVKAHRMSYELLVGEIPTGLVLDHLCRNRSCVNPTHLKDVRNAERRKLLCKNGHPIDKEKMRVDGRIMRWCSICQKEKSNKMIKAHWGNK